MKPIDMNEQLKPCPFCGCEMQLQKCMMADGRTIRYEPRGHHKYGCQLRFATGCFVGNPTTIDGAIKKWNRRAIDVPVPQHDKEKD